MADPKQQLPGSEKLVTDIEFTQRSASEAFLIAAIVNREFFRITKHFDPASENTNAKRMERRNRWRVIDLIVAAFGFYFFRFSFVLSIETTNHLAKPFFHLVGSFVGERHAEDSLTGNSRFDELGDAKRNHSRLASSRTGQNQHGAGKRIDGVELIWIETTHERTVFALVLLKLVLLN